MAGHIISPQAILAALEGQAPALGHPISAEELGRRLAEHRRGRFPGTPFGRAAISLYKVHPQEQSEDFQNAFRSWAAAESLRQAKLRVRFGGLTVDDLLNETGYVQQLGADPVKALIAVGELPAETLISVNGAASVIECTAEIGMCECGQKFVRRSWNQVRCKACRIARRRHLPPVGAG
jgi:hypothetical protein